MFFWLTALMSGQRWANDPTTHHLKHDPSFWEAVIKRDISGLVVQADT